MDDRGSYPFMDSLPEVDDKQIDKLIRTTMATKKMYTYRLILEDGTSFNYVFEHGIRFNDKEKDLSTLITSAMFLEMNEKEEMDSVAEGLNADAIAQLDEVVEPSAEEVAAEEALEVELV